MSTEEAARAVACVLAGLLRALRPRARVELARRLGISRYALQGAGKARAPEAVAEAIAAAERIDVALSRAYMARVCAALAQQAGSPIVRRLWLELPEGFLPLLRAGLPVQPAGSSPQQADEARAPRHGAGHDDAGHDKHDKGRVQRRVAAG